MEIKKDPPMKDFKNKTVWITGASDGIGKELSIQLADRGARVILSSRNVEKLNAVCAQLKGDDHVVYPMDLLKTEEIPQATENLLTQVGDIHILINNAGITQRSLTVDTDLSVDRKIMELDYFAPIIMTKAMLNHMIGRGNGSIVTISSVAGKVGVPMRSAYCAAKHAIIGFMGSLRAEIHRHGIHVLIVAPGSTHTNISINAIEGDGKVHGVTDPAIANGLPVSIVAKKTIEAIIKQKSEIIIANKRESRLALLYRLAPEMVIKKLRNMRVT